MTNDILVSISPYPPIITYYARFVNFYRKSKNQGNLRAVLTVMYF